jgi:hypothetical protein
MRSHAEAGDAARTPAPRARGVPAAGRLARAAAPPAAAAAAALVVLYAIAMVRGAQAIGGPLGDASWFNRSPAWHTTTGFYNAEGTLDGLQFSWTGGLATIRIPSLDRSVPYRVSLLVRGGRLDSAPFPVVSFTVDGREAARALVDGERRRIELDVPPRPDAGVTIGIHPSHTFVPPDDPRQLGIIVEDARIEPAGGGRFPIAAGVAARAGAAAALLGAAAVFCGLPLAAAVAASSALGAGLGWLTMHGAAFIGAYPERILWLGAASAGAALAVAAGRAIAPGPVWPLAAFIAIAATAIRIGIFWHPGAPVGDSIFHVHRAQSVMRGGYYFTSVTPRPFFEFPYAIALYVFVKPWWRAIPDHVMLLRGATLVAEGAAAMVLCATVWRIWENRRTALLATLFYALSPIAMQTVCIANLTNMFGQSVFTIAVCAIALCAGRVGPLAALLIATPLVAVAFLSHFSTLSIGLPLVSAFALLLSFAGRPEARRARWWVAGAVIAASIGSYVVYYSRFHAVYRATWARVTAEEGREVTTSMLGPAGAKLPAFIGYTRGAFGDAALVAAAVGLLLLVAQRRRDPLAIAVWAWAAAFTGFAALGVLTPIEMRATLASQPLVAILAAFAMSWPRRAWSPAGVVAAAVALAIAATGIYEWRMCLGDM